MKNYRLTTEYDGTKYSGWEEKEGRDTIQGKLQGVLERLCGEPVKVIGAGRTDAGVHAKGMVANVHMSLPHTSGDNRKNGKDESVIIRDYLNRYLPEDICVKDVSEVSERFHARYNAIAKSYCYTLYCGEVKTIFDRKYVYQIDFRPDIEAMKRAAEYCIGEKDFASFCGNSHMKKSTVRKIDSIEIVQNGDYITLTYHGDGFLQHQIRIMTGTLLEVGKGSFPAEHVKEIIKGMDRELAGPTLPAKGLCLMNIEY